MLERFNKSNGIGEKSPVIYREELWYSIGTIQQHRYIHSQVQAFTMDILEGSELLMCNWTFEQFFTLICACSFYVWISFWFGSKVFICSCTFDILGHTWHNKAILAWLYTLGVTSMLGACYFNFGILLHLLHFWYFGALLAC